MTKECCYKWMNFEDFLFSYVVRKEQNFKETMTETVRKYRIRYCPECGMKLNRVKNAKDFLQK